MDEIVRTEVGDDKKPLSNLLDARTLERKIAGYIIEARAWIEAKAQAGRDFELHEGVDVYFDGNGRDTLDLAAFGFVPLIDISNLKLCGWPVEVNSSYTATTRGILKRNITFLLIPPKVGLIGSPFFVLGTQNIEATITWGYQTCPSDIKAAQAMKVVAELLRFVDRSDSESGEVPGGVQQVKWGEDLVINTGVGGRYGKAVRDLEREAQQMAWRYRTSYVTGARQVR